MTQALHSVLASGSFHDFYLRGRNSLIYNQIMHRVAQQANESVGLFYDVNSIELLVQMHH